ncbi:ARM repeat-containing protein [Massarina eburnea CBS 473.64]|uniref:ARM repeat-containing protein n=1 Tax=Massarina eburnea CBS 473.64 TaxID=1395130 RepID=A0A6A6SIL4_9PLEO|nr:ARM repeat-containing protein [Massarina eburnea CBS 473.64]
MPGRTSTRASTRTRASAPAVEIPDEGPENSLRTQICQIFSDAQNTTATQRKLQANLRKLQVRCCPQVQGDRQGKRQEEEFDEEVFNDEVMRCVLRVMVVKRGEPVGDRIIKFLGLFLKYASEKGKCDRAIFQSEDETEIAIFPETPSSRLTAHILTTLLGFLTAKDKVVRFRATQMVAHIINSLDAIDDEIFRPIVTALVRRLRDKESSVRVQSVIGLHRLAGNEDGEDDDLDSDDDGMSGIMQKLVEVMADDSGAEVRRAVLKNLPLENQHLHFFLERARDSDVMLRRYLYSTILPSLGDFRHLTLVQREKIIRWGLRDRDDAVRKATARLFTERWLENCASSRDTRPAEEKKPGDPIPPNLEALAELLERIDVTHSGAEEGIAHEAMRIFWDSRHDYRDSIWFDVEFWNELDAQRAFVARTLNDYCNNTEEDRVRDKLEDKIPEVLVLAEVINKHLKRLMDLVEKRANMTDDDSEIEEVDEDQEGMDFVVQQLLHIALTLDYTDVYGRQRMMLIMREALARAQLPEECTKLTVEVLRTCCVGGEVEFCNVILEAIIEVRDTLVDDATELGDEMNEDSFHSAIESPGSDDAPAVPNDSKKKAKQLSPEEEERKRERERLVHEKCLHIIQCALQNVECDLETTASLNTMLEEFIAPAVRSQDGTIRERAVLCLGLMALLSKDLALKNMELFFKCFTKGHNVLKEISLQVLTDIVITHPSLFAPPAPDPDASTTSVVEGQQLNPFMKAIHKVLLKGLQSDNKQVSHIACTAASKLLLLSTLPPVPTASILKAFVLAYFNPDTSTNPALRQALTYFIPVFCHSKLRNALLMAQITVPIISKLILMREELDMDEDEEMVGWPVITAHLADWTDGRKVVGMSTMGIDGKPIMNAQAEEPHIALATKLIERALGNSSRDERKPLLSLLTKTTILASGPAEDEEALQTLHGLVSEAVEGKIGVDATQRNFLVKLDNGLTTRLGDAEVATQTEQSRDGSATPTPEPAVTAARETREATETREAREVTETRETREGTEATETTEVGDAPEIPNEVDMEDVDEDEDEDEDTMMAGVQAEGTRFPLEEEEEDEPRGITESDIVESLLQTEMSD